MNENPKADHEPQDSSQIDVTKAVNLKRSYLKIAVMLAFVAACVAIIHFSPLKNYVTNVQAMKSALAQTGIWAPLIFFAVTAASIFVGAPRTPFCFVGGVLFGFVQGLVLAQFATLLGAYGPYLFARHSANDWVTKKLGKYEKLKRYLDNPTAFDVFLFRQIPIWGLVGNLLMGSIGVSHFRFAVGSFVGFLPQAIVFALMGSGLAEESFLHALSRLLTAIPVLAIGAYITWRLITRVKRSRRATKKGASQ